MPFGLYNICFLYSCPGFSQDRVNFHQKPGRGTAGWAGPTPTWTKRARYSIPCAVMLCSGGGGGAAGTHLRLGSARRRSGPGDASVKSWGLCRVFSLSVSLLFLFPLVAVLLNCPYPDPPVSACFFPFSSAPRRGEGRPRGAFVAGGSRNQNKVSVFWPAKASVIPLKEVFDLAFSMICDTIFNYYQNYSSSVRDKDCKRKCAGLQLLWYRLTSYRCLSSHSSHFGIKAGSQTYLLQIWG